MTLRELATLVRDCRQAQRDFFRSAPGSAERSEALGRSKRLEKRVDLAVRDCLDDQPSLFGEEVDCA